MNRAISFAAFFLGLFVVGWVGLGYLGASPLALLMTVLIGVVFVVGAVELWRFNAATDRLTGALAAIPEPLPALGDWLAGLPAPLQTPVRLRIDGERVGLPGPALTPYLVGLLVLLGMLGTFLGMVVTLNGAVIALESSTDLATIRGALSAPVKGLGVAFGTSVAGVAASAMLGLISAFSRRDRLGAAQQLDAAIVSRLRPYSFAHQREETFRALQQQAQVLPDVAERLQAMMAHLEHHGEALGQRLLDAQQTHYQDARGLFADLAASVDASFTRSLTETSRLAGETLRPAVEAAMAGIASETAQLHARVAGTVDAQLDGIARRFDTSVGTVTDGWTAALARHEATSTAAADGLRDALAAFNASFDERATALLAEVEQRQTTAQADLSATLAAVTADSRALNGQLAERVGQQLDGLGERFAGAVGTVTDGWTAALVRHEATSTAAADGLRDALAGFNASFDERATALLAEVEQRQATAQADLSATLAAVTADSRALNGQLAERVGQQLDGLGERFAGAVGTVTNGWTAALARHEATSTAAADGLRDALAGFNASFDERATALLAGVEQRQTTAQAELSATLAAVTADSRSLNGQLAERVGLQLDGLGERFSGAVGTVTDGWTAALARHEATSTAAADGLRDALAAFNASFEARAGALIAEHARTSAGLAADTRAALQSFADTFATRSAALVATVHDAHTALQRDATGRDAAQLEATHAAVDALLTRLRDEWQAVGARAVAQQDALCASLETTARRVAEAAEAQASRTIDEVAGLMAQVADAPKAAAEVVGALRSELSASIARDTAQLAERSRIMDTLATLLEAINHASTEQRSAIDALVSSASGLLERLGARFEERMGAEAGRMADIADRIGSGAIEVASLGEAFGGAVQMFADASDGLLGSLQRIESALEKSTTRSDEQLAYYVAQAREVIDLSILSQKQIVEDLQRLAARPAGEG